MPPFIFRCPNTGFRVQGFAPDDDVSEGANNVGVTCLVCGLMHLVNPKTGKTAGEDGE
jgi:hypothetical protein